MDDQSMKSTTIAQLLASSAQIFERLAQQAMELSELDPIEQLDGREALRYPGSSYSNMSLSNESAFDSDSNDRLVNESSSCSPIDMSERELPVFEEPASSNSIIPLPSPINTWSYEYGSFGKTKADPVVQPTPLRIRKRKEPCKKKVSSAMQMGRRAQTNWTTGGTLPVIRPKLRPDLKNLTIERMRAIPMKFAESAPVMKVKKDIARITNQNGEFNAKPYKLPF